jgi:hypothetical protein
LRARHLFLGSAVRPAANALATKTTTHAAWTNEKRRAPQPPAREEKCGEEGGETQVTSTPGVGVDNLQLVSAISVRVFT